MAALPDTVADAQAAKGALMTVTGRKPFVMVDGYNLGMEKGTGVATYGRNLTLSLKELGCEVGVLHGAAVSRRSPPLLREVLFYDAREETSPWPRFSRRFRAVLGPRRNVAFRVPATGTVVTEGLESASYRADSIWNARDLFFKANAQHDLLGVFNTVTGEARPDLFHWTYPLPIRFKGVPNIYTLHDLVPLRLPYATLDKKARYWNLLRWICRTADHIVTVSESSKRDIVELLGVDPQRVTNTYQSVTIPADYLEKSEAVVQQEIAGSFGLKYKGYFLYFGSIEPKKNVGRMLEGYLSSGSSTPLVIVGAQEWKAERELRLLSGEGVRSRLRGRDEVGQGEIVRLEYVPFSWLVTLIRGAKAVLFPSLYEGFGLPLLEAMTLGTPVLTSNTSSLPELAGDSALLVNPYDGHTIARGIAALDTSSELRTMLAAKGRERAMLFSASAYKERLLRVYKAVLERRNADTTAPVEIDSRRDWERRRRT